MISLIIIYIKRVLAVFRHPMRSRERASRYGTNSKQSFIKGGAEELDPNISDAFDVSSAEGLLQEKWLSGELMKESMRFVANQRSVHTRRAYEGDLKQFIGYIRAENASGESFDLLVKYRDWLVREKDKGGLGLKRGSANRKFATVRSFLTWLQSRGKIRENPSLWVRNFRAKVESSTQGFSDFEVSRMLEIPSLRTDSGRMHSLILHFLFYMGLRRSELVALRASNIERARVGENLVLTLRIPGKGDKERILPIPEKVKDRLSHYMAKKSLSIGEDVPLFSPVRNNITGVKTKAIDATAIYYIVKKYATLAGVERRVSPHSCRATCISNALDHAASHRAVQELAGWSSPLMIERYDKRRTALQDSAVHVVDY
ncbi:MAG: tyrosine-type recombinase/integrase [Oligoflexia bacterium]|nr:tyrosine-type recombinase/integrase [Oligoflexia bacterium]